MLATTWSKPIATKAMIGKKMRQDLAGDVVGGERHPDREADEPVAAQRAQEDLPLASPRRPWRGDPASRSSGSSAVSTPVWTARK